MISISGNAHRDWIETGVESNDKLLTVNCCGYQKLMTTDLTRNREQGRMDYQLIYLVGGKGSFTFNKKETVVHSGQIVVYTPNDPQHYSFSARDATEAYWIHFTGYNARDFLQRCGLLDTAIQSVGHLDEAGTLFRKIIHELNMNKPLSGQMTTAYLLNLFALLGRSLHNKGTRRKVDAHADINKIIEIMHENYSQQLLVTELAKTCNLSLFRFIHKFKEVTATTPVKYLTGIRINEAKKMLSETTLNVKEVAAIVGYENPLYFSRVFGHVVGIPPSQYKRVDAYES